MPSEATRAEESYFAISDAEVEENIALCKGNLRETIRQLLVGQAGLEHEISQLKWSSSRGFARKPAGAPELK